MINALFSKRDIAITRASRNLFVLDKYLLRQYCFLNV
jgi:hypothetical protein